jgi:hypothetical protein
MVHFLLRKFSQGARAKFSLIKKGSSVFPPRLCLTQPSSYRLWVRIHELQATPLVSPHTIHKATFLYCDITAVFLAPEHDVKWVMTSLIAETGWGDDSEIVVYVCNSFWPLKKKVNNWAAIVFPVCAQRFPLKSKLESGQPPNCSYSSISSIMSTTQAYPPSKILSCASPIRVGPDLPFRKPFGNLPCKEAGPKSVESSWGRRHQDREKELTLCQACLLRYLNLCCYLGRPVVDLQFRKEET